MHLILSILILIGIIYYAPAILFLVIVAILVYLISSNMEIAGWILVGLSCLVMVAAIVLTIYRLINKLKQKNIKLKRFSLPPQKLSNASNTQEIDREKFQLNENYNKFDYAQSITDFRAKYPFVMVDVHPLKQTQFISECEWLQNKIGHFPSETDQQAILRSLGDVAK